MKKRIILVLGLFLAYTQASKTTPGFGGTIKESYDSLAIMTQQKIRNNTQEEVCHETHNHNHCGHNNCGHKYAPMPRVQHVAKKLMPTTTRRQPKQKLRELPDLFNILAQNKAESCDDETLQTCHVCCEDVPKTEYGYLRCCENAKTLLCKNCVKQICTPTEERGSHPETIFYTGPHVNAAKTRALEAARPHNNSPYLWLSTQSKAYFLEGTKLWRYAHRSSCGTTKHWRYIKLPNCPFCQKSIISHIMTPLEKTPLTRGLLEQFLQEHQHKVSPSQN